MTLERRTELKRGKGLKRSRKPIKARSDRKAATDEVLDQAREERRRLAGGRCEGNTPGCQRGVHDGVLAHHVRRRKGQADVHAVEHLRWLCWPGHEWVHAHVAEAKAMGLLA